MIIKESKNNTEYLKKYLKIRNEENLKSIIITIDFLNGTFNAQKVEDETIDYNEWEKEKNIGLLSNLLYEFLRFELHGGQTNL